jgi:8-hydroxy-5-deazaflavin:NADPH oxidoreductase
MKYAILGTGMVGRAHAARLTELGHAVTMGTQDVAKTMASTRPDGMGNPPFSQWHQANPAVKLAAFADATDQGEVIINALAGHVAVEVLKKIGEGIGRKVLIDISNPLDFSKGLPPTLSVCNTSSLGEQIQQALPQAKVVKAFNTTTAAVQVNPQLLSNGEHDIFVSGNDAGAKATVVALQKSYGWQNPFDLGDITSARGAEMFLPLWLRIFAALDNPLFNIKLIAPAKT